LTAVSREGESAQAAYAVRQVRDRGELRAILTQEQEYSAYAIAQLDPRSFPLNEWLIATGPGGRRSLVVHSHTGLGNALFATGDPVALDAILSLHPGPRFSFGSLRPEHKRVVEKHFLMGRTQMMIRMSLSPESFTPAEEGAVRLTGADVREVNRLYSTEGSQTSYTPSHIDEGVYYGVFGEGDRLISVAGTHTVSFAEGAAVVGNVYTHPRHRGQGLARQTTSGVTAALLDAACELVVLTVEEGNAPARAVYERLGYVPVCRLHESPLIRKDPFGTLSLTRRWLAGWRGRKEGAEVVVR
jgi:ribosomal protein S18 acetylase RimI-like enzyme